MELSEVDKINDCIKNQQGYLWPYELPDPNEEEASWSNTVDMQHLDPLFEDAARYIVRELSGSTSLIQRKYGIGYNRAGRLMDQLEKAGIVGEAHGSKPREVLIKDDYSLNLILNKYR
jgi:S-DNA-T family DNA segregation ATPase FtsK/SpoIIIE